ncbi:MAG: hypothetical protein KBB70_01295 [Candidatus Pacebacteria bacterium]|nr:hypothetical protein [Candidatus Paceibacterota bacterium]
MENQLPDGAQFLILKENRHGKATAFTEFPIELSTLTAVNFSEADFIKAGRVGFILDRASDEDATIRFLNAENAPLTVAFGKTEVLTIQDVIYTIELWAVRHNATEWDKWRISFN